MSRRNISRTDYTLFKTCEYSNIHGDACVDTGRLKQYVDCSIFFVEYPKRLKFTNLLLLVKQIYYDKKINLFNIVK